MGPCAPQLQAASHLNATAWARGRRGGGVKMGRRGRTEEEEEEERSIGGESQGGRRRGAWRGGDGVGETERGDF